ncbi:hypothetical protein HPP92_018545 [Vanilla planifolia]|uniref:U1-type domain-containing protein n=1 Tax=Vanilla planifolia TaxID=51239 RepID=A0A835QA07_VANPL|nr:hypothetical protein HPP92_018545 [Vanilla planifolia]
MDFNPYSPGALGSSVSSFSDGYFSSRSLHSAAYGSGGMRRLPPPRSAREEMEREMLKRQIRDEILAREEQRRLLEEEVRREMEMERVLERRRFQMESWSSLDGSGHLLMQGQRAMQCFEPFAGDRHGVLVRRGLVQEAPEVVFSERAPNHLLQKRAVPVGKPTVPRGSEMTSGSNEIKPPDCKISGPKALGEQKQLVCAVHKVTSTNEEGRKEHPRGKKHKAKEALLRPKKKTVCEPKKELAEDRKQQRIWCNLCNVNCNSQVMMESHLSGKRHKKLLESNKGDSKVQIVKEEPIINLAVGDEDCMVQALVST